MDRADQGKELLIFLTKDCFVPVLKKGGPNGGVFGCSRRHTRWASFLGRVLYSLRTTSDQQMNVVIHKDPGVKRSTCLYDACLPSLTEFRPIEIILKECSLVDPSHHDVMQGSCSI